MSCKTQQFINPAGTTFLYEETPGCSAGAIFNDPQGNPIQDYCYMTPDPENPGTLKDDPSGCSKGNVVLMNDNTIKYFPNIVDICPNYIALYYLLLLAAVLCLVLIGLGITGLTPPYRAAFKNVNNPNIKDTIIATLASLLIFGAVILTICIYGIVSLSKYIV